MSSRAYAAIAVLLGLGAFAAAPAAQADDACHLQQVTSFPLTTAADGRLLVETAVNGQPARMLLSTDAPITLLNFDYVRSHDLAYWQTRAVPYNPDRWTRIATESGRNLRGWARVGELGLGDIDYTTNWVGLTSVAGDAGQPDGVIAGDYIAPWDVEIDPAAGRMVLYSPEHCKGQVVYWAKDYYRLPMYLNGYYRPEVPIVIDGQRLRARIDTATAVTTMRLSTARFLYGIDPNEVPPKDHLAVNTYDGVHIDNFPHSFGNLSFGDLTLKNPTLRIADIGAGRTREPDVIIGMSLLSKLHMFISYRESAIYYTLEEPGQPAS